MMHPRNIQYGKFTGYTNAYPWVTPKPKGKLLLAQKYHFALYGPEGRPAPPALPPIKVLPLERTAAEHVVSGEPGYHRDEWRRPLRDLWRGFAKWLWFK